MTEGRCNWPHCRALGDILLQGKDFCDEHASVVLQSVTKDADLTTVLQALKNLTKPKAT